MTDNLITSEEVLVEITNRVMARITENSESLDDMEVLEDASQVGSLPAYKVDSSELVRVPLNFLRERVDEAAGLVEESNRQLNDYLTNTATPAAERAEQAATSANNKTTELTNTINTLVNNTVGEQGSVTTAVANMNSRLTELEVGIIGENGSITNIVKEGGIIDQAISSMNEEATDKIDALKAKAESDLAEVTNNAAEFKASVEQAATVVTNSATDITELKKKVGNVTIKTISITQYEGMTEEQKDPNTLYFCYEEDITALTPETPTV